MENLFSWLRPQGLPPNQTMAEQRTLWCAYDNDLESLIPVECTVGESVGHVKERIKDKSDDLHVAAFRLNIFLPLTPIKHVFSEHEHQKLHSRDVIFADQPRSADPFVDLVCVRPKTSDSVPRDRGKFAPPWCVWTVADEA